MHGHSKAILLVMASSLSGCSGSEPDDASTPFAAAEAAAQDGRACKAPAVERVRLDLSRCAASKDCLVAPRGSVAGFVPAGAPPNPSSAAKVLELSNPGSKDEEITSNGATYGLNRSGGGYGSYFRVPGEGNIARVGYGDGWQSDLRDGYHDGRWNPTQAGSAWALGSPARLEKIGRGFRIRRFDVPLFMNDSPDFVQNDEINAKAGRDFSPRKVNGRDEDGCAERNFQEELRSELDFDGEVEDVSGEIGTNIPAFRFRNQLTYERNPGALLQFINPKNPAALSSWLDERSRTFLSPVAYDRAPAGQTDVGLATLTWGLRLKENSPFRFLGSKREGGSWHFHPLKPGGEDRSRVYLGIARRETSYAKAQFVSGKPLSAKAPDVVSYVVLADGDDRAKSRAIGVYYPLESPTNKFQTVGIENGKIAYAENRLISADVMGVAVDMAAGTGYNLLVRINTNGLLEPRRAAKGIREAVRSEVYAFYGTPDQIERAVRLVKAGGK